MRRGPRGPRCKVTLDIPRRVRRLVELRDHGRCVVPGCRSSLGLEIHHITDRAEGGTHEPDNLCLLCAAHHHQRHAGKLRIIGRAPDRLRFEHEDGRLYGAPPRRDLFAEAKAALRDLGYNHSEAQRAVQEVRATVTDAERSDLETLLRACLRACRVGTVRVT